MTPTDIVYINLINTLTIKGELVPSRNGNTYRVFDLPTVKFDTTPLVSVRKTAWKKAIREMEWFLSGAITCPDELLDWWKPQLTNTNCYINGYSEQLRHFNERYDQIKPLIEGICTHPFSRRHVITTWNPEDMAFITISNNNPLTPTTCHTTIAQFFVSQDHSLSLHSYQRSADMLLGVPHNWIQSWALLLWLCEQTDTFPGKMLWTFGDAHIYREPSHMKVVDQITSLYHRPPTSSPRLHYAGQKGSEFAASDFEMIGEIPNPVITVKPKLL